MDSLVRLPHFRNAHWGLLVVHPESGDTVYSHNAGKLFMPASNQKLLTGATALAILGPGHRFRTTLVATGPVTNGVLDGDLVAVGGFDPSMSDAMQQDAMRPLRALADSVRARGIREIRGRVLAARDSAVGTGYGFGWAWDDMDYAYSAPAGELLFNEGYSRVVLRGGRTVGEPSTFGVFPATDYPRIVNRAQTATGEARALSRTRSWTWDDSLRAYVVRGGIAPGDSAVLNVAHRDARQGWIAAFRQALAEREVAIRLPAVRKDVAPSRQDTVATWMSSTLAEIMPHFEKPSQNQIGELLLLALGRERTGVASADSGRAVVERQLVAWGADTAGFAVRDGSGLSRHDYVTPETIVRVLDAMRRSPHFATFRDALPVAGVDGTIANRMKGTPAQGNVRAKTGFVDKARSLSGYVTTADGEFLIFSALANNWTVPTRMVEQVQDTLAVRLAGARWSELREQR